MPNTRVQVADIRDLRLAEGPVDVVFVVGRVFTHMLTPTDASKALESIYQALKPGGVVLLDNYEDSKIRVTNYFNGRVVVRDSDVEIVRDSTTEQISKSPFVVRWSAEYRATSGGATATFRDVMPHRAFSRDEMAALFREHGFTVCMQGDNFDETSFFTLASRYPSPFASPHSEDSRSGPARRS